MKDEITFDDFMKLDIRVATILEAEKHPKADRLLVLKVDTGVDQRTIVSGIAEHYKPEEVVGRTVTVLLNLVPIADPFFFSFLIFCLGVFSFSAV